MIVGGQTEARAQLSSTIIDYHEPFDQGFRSEDEGDYEYDEFSVLSTRTSKNVGLQTLCACSVRKTRTRSRPRPPI